MIDRLWSSKDPASKFGQFNQTDLGVFVKSPFLRRYGLERAWLPILFTHWRLDELDGLSDPAERAREEIEGFLGALDRTAATYEEKRAAAEGR